jgi:hypothetical protein
MIHLDFERLSLMSLKFSAAFSLLGHLNLDLELDEEIPFSIPPAMQDQAGDPQTHINASTTSIHPTAYHLPAPASTVAYNPSLPFFFPSSTHPHNKTSANQTQGVLANWRAPAVSFFRTEREDVIGKNGRRGGAS